MQVAPLSQLRPSHWGVAALLIAPVLPIMQAVLLAPALPEITRSFSDNPEASFMAPAFGRLGAVRRPIPD